jgi:hypothetical protein
MKNLLSFVLGLIIGAGLLFGYYHAPQLKNLFRSQEDLMQTSVSGPWQGTIQINGADIAFSLAVMKNGGSLSGVITATQVGDIPCDQIAVDPSGNISFSAHVNDKSATFTGKVAPDARSMTGNYNSNAIGTGGWSLAKP